MNAAQQLVRIVVSYARKNEDHRKQLDKYIQPICGPQVEYWSDKSLGAGAEYKPIIMETIKNADIVVALISADYLASDFCMKELDAAMRRRQAGTCVVAPIIVDHCLYQHTVVGQLNVFPGNAKPIVDWRPRSRAWTDVVARILKEVQKIREVGVLPADSDIDRILRPFNRISPEIRRSLEQADSFWLLTRSGVGWWHDFEQFGNLITRPPDSRNRILVLDPRSGAFQSYRHDWTTWVFKPKDTFEDYTQHVEEFLREKILAGDTHALDARALDVRSPLSLLFVNPARDHDERCCLYVEYPSLASPSMTSSDYQEKPIVKISRNEHEHHYRHFAHAFTGLWEQGKPLRDIKLA